MNLLEHVHQHYVHNRRTSILRDHLVQVLPQNASILDIGCGDGLLAELILQHRPDLQIQGVDVLRRNDCRIPLKEFDGSAIPYNDGAFDVALFVDVLHHTRDPMVLLTEAVRIARKAIVIKDHICSGPFDAFTLRLMDHVGNCRHGVALPYNYWSAEKWFAAVELLGLRVTAWKKDLRLYPYPARWFFDRSLHFISRLELNHSSNFSHD